MIKIINSVDLFIASRGIDSFPSETLTKYSELLNSVLIEKNRRRN